MGLVTKDLSVRKQIKCENRRKKQEDNILLLWIHLERQSLMNTIIKEQNTTLRVITEIFVVC